MNIYGIGIFGNYVGYVIADDKNQALTKATNVLGFQDFDEYLDIYPGRYSEGSSMQGLTLNIFEYNYLKAHGVLEDNIFILMANEVKGETCIHDLIRSAKYFSNGRHRDDACWFDRTLIVLKIDELKRCYPTHFANNRWDAHMWYCEDWTEETK